MIEIILVIQFLLIVFKLVGVLAWEWYQILAPCWCSVLILLALLGLRIMSGD